MMGKLEAVLIPENGIPAKLEGLRAATLALREELSKPETNSAPIRTTVGTALEALHSLNDLQGNGWDNSKWSDADKHLLMGHIAARNIMHHQDSAVIRIQHLSESSERCSWSITQEQLDQLRGGPERNGANYYKQMLDQKPVLSSLEALVMLIQGSVTSP